jgi:hypothetical protein
MVFVRPNATKFVEEGYTFLIHFNKQSFNLNDKPMDYYEIMDRDV